jgi:PAS domain S-box-containing protein
VGWVPAFVTQLLASDEHGRLLEAVEASAEQIKLAIAVVRVDLAPPVVLYLGESMERLFGRPLAELAEGSPLRHLVPEDRAKIQALIASRPVGAPPIPIEAEIDRGDGTRLPIEVGVARISSSLGELAVCHMRDISARRAALAALRRSEAQLRGLLDQAPDGVVILRAGRIVYANATAADLLGVPVDDVVGRAIGSLLPAADAARAGARIREMVETGATFPPSEYGVLAAPERAVEIKSIPCEWEGAPAVLAFARDVTERATLHRRLAQAERLTSLGTLAAAVAHEINNPLTYATIALSRVEHGLAALDASGELREQVRHVRDGMDRVVAIARDLTRYARDGAVELGPVDLASVLARALELVGHELDGGGRVERRLAPVPPVEGHAIRLEQVFVNLLVNAAHAGRGTAADRIAIETAVEDGAVRVVVADNGVGMTDAVRERAFEPFFTTKPPGKGTGLGLAVSRTMVEAMGGRVELDSRPGAGTRVTVWLRPATGRGPEPAAPPAPRAARRRLLVVDDEPKIREVIRLLLGDTHDIVDVGDGAAALAALEEGAFDVVLCDLMMPGMNGMELYRAIRERHPGVERRIVFVTGGAFGAEVRGFLDGTANPRLFKPFTGAELDRAIAAV